MTVPSQWVALARPDGSGNSGRDDASAVGVVGGGECTTALLARVACFRRVDLGSVADRDALFDLYTRRAASSGEAGSAAVGSSGPGLPAAGFDAVLRDVSASRSVDEGAGSADAAAEDTRPHGACRTCLGHMFASIGYYAPNVPLFSYLMYYHTLLWIGCRAPGEEHIPIMHRLGFVLLSLVFNLLVVVLFTATDCSLISLNCPPEAGCSPFALRAWGAAEVLPTAHPRTLAQRCGPCCASCAAFAAARAWRCPHRSHLHDVWALGRVCRGYLCVVLSPAHRFCSSL